MKKLIQKLLNLGVEEGTSNYHRRKVQLLNEVVLLIFPFVCLLILEDVYNRDAIGAGINISVLGFLILTLVFQSKGLFHFSTIYLVTLFGATMAILHTVYGPSLKVEYAYFNLVMFSVLFFEKLRSQVIIFLYLVISYLFSYFYIQEFDPPLAGKLNEYTPLIMFFANLAVLFSQVMMFVFENKKFETETVKLYEDLKDKNQSLQDFKTQMELKNNELEEANTELERFAYVASHDLKTPLRNINSFLSLLERKLNPEQKTKVKEYIDFIQNSAKRMYYLIEDVLQFSRLGVEKNISVQVDLNPLIQTIKTQTALAFEKEVIIELSELPKVMANEIQMQVLFQNLIENSLKYNKNNPVVIQINGYSKEGQYLIQIRDNGLGISESYEHKIFEMFSRLHNQDDYEGTGLGLAICKKIMNRYEGQIRLADSSENGSTFELSFPIEIISSN